MCEAFNLRIQNVRMRQATTWQSANSLLLYGKGQALAADITSSFGTSW